MKYIIEVETRMGFTYTIIADGENLTAIGEMMERDGNVEHYTINREDQVGWMTVKH